MDGWLPRGLAIPVMIVCSATPASGATPWLTRTSLGERRSGGLPRGKVAVHALLARSCCEAANGASLASVLLIRLLASPKGALRKRRFAPPSEFGVSASRCEWIRQRGFISGRNLSSGVPFLIFPHAIEVTQLVALQAATGGSDLGHARTGDRAVRRQRRVAVGCAVFTE
ncbi:hypothetical protein MRX96_052069 [Rhipicephalus microplus]